jgi:hypothetical protein
MKAVQANTLAFLDTHLIPHLSNKELKSKLLEEIAVGNMDHSSKIFSAQQLVQLGVPLKLNPIHEHFYKLVEHSLPV